MRFRCVKGMQDILPPGVERWQAIETSFRRAVELHRYAEVRTPVLEQTQLYVRSIGETTDVVDKEMFTFQRSDESLTLRPEYTAGVARAYVEHSVHTKEPVTRWYYLGPMFRAERPQRGRYRQFHQAGCEIYGDPGPACDAEMIDMLARWLTELGIPSLEVRIGSLGGPDARARFRAALLEYLRPRASQLSEHALARLEQNPLRVIDSKDEGDQRVVAGAPSMLDLLEGEDKSHWDGLRLALDAMGTEYIVDPGLVRGLDYYTRTVFEIRSSSGDLGAQNTLAGGGRYDGMIEGLGGPRVGAIGFAMGLERLLLALPEAAPARALFCFIAPLGARAQREALVLARELRMLGVAVDVDGRGGSLRSMLRRADGMKAPLCVVMGDSELDRGQVQLKELERHAQQELDRAGAAPVIRDRLAALGSSQGEGSL